MTTWQWENSKHTQCMAMIQFEKKTEISYKNLHQKKIVQIVYTFHLKWS